MTKFIEVIIHIGHEGENVWNEELGDFVYQVYEFPEWGYEYVDYNKTNRFKKKAEFDKLSPMEQDIAKKYGITNCYIINNKFTVIISREDLCDIDDEFTMSEMFV